MFSWLGSIKDSTDAYNLPPIPMQADFKPMYNLKLFCDRKLKHVHSVSTFTDTIVVEDIALLSCVLRD